jgi:MFS family permease
VRAALRLLRGERSARLFFAALIQSSVGTGAGYVALMLVAYARFRSPWAISLILLADFLPVMLLGPLLGAAADRWSRRWCIVAADVVRALAFAGIPVVHSFELTFVLALLAGAGTALFRPAALAAAPQLVPEGAGSAATSLFSAVTQLGWTLGPALAALIMLVASPATVLAGNGATFAISALVVARLPLDRDKPAIQDGEAPVRTSLLREGLSGMRAVSALVDVRVVMLASAAAMFFGGVFNVAEPLFATQTIVAGKAGYSVLVAIYGLGFIAGSLGGSQGGGASLFRRRYIQGLALTGLGSLSTAAAPGLSVALLAFLLAGFGNGVFVVHERLLILDRVPEELFARAFSLNDMFSSGSLVASFGVAGIASSAVGPRGLILAVAIGELMITLVVAVTLRARAALRLSASDQAPSGQPR